MDVTADAPLIQSQSGERSFSIPTSTAANLPISNRNFASLTTLVPGALGTSRLGGGGQNNFQMDGVSTMDTGNNGQLLQMNLEAIFDLRQVAGGIAFMLADSNEKDDGSMECYTPEAVRQLSKNLFSGLFATNRNYRCGGTVNTGRGQIKNTGYRVCVAYHTHNPQLGDYRRRVAECEIDMGSGDRG